MISANEARIKTEENDKSYKKELLEIEKMINKAVSLGEYYISGNYALGYRTIQELKRLGYKVNVDKTYIVGDYYISTGRYNISWESE